MITISIAIARDSRRRCDKGSRPACLEPLEEVRQSLDHLNDYHFHYHSQGLGAQTRQGLETGVSRLGALGGGTFLSFVSFIITLLMIIQQYTTRRRWHQHWHIQRLEMVGVPARLERYKGLRPVCLEPLEVSFFLFICFF
jgi:hypothetical protein